MALKDLARYSTGLDFRIFLLGFDVTNFFCYFLCSLIDDEYSVSILTILSGIDIGKVGWWGCTVGHK